MPAKAKAYLNTWQGSFTVYLETWKVNYFVNVMTVDFFLFPIAFAFVLADDMRRRNIPINGLFWLYALIPVLGAVSHLQQCADLGSAEGL
ncbi:MAG: hypothetical protein V7746_18365 [Halioglobus sp.]